MSTLLQQKRSFKGGDGQHMLPKRLQVEEPGSPLFIAELTDEILPQHVFVRAFLGRVCACAVAALLVICIGVAATARSWKLERSRPEQLPPSYELQHRTTRLHDWYLVLCALRPRMCDDVVAAESGEAQRTHEWQRDVGGPVSLGLILHDDAGWACMKTQ
eukprot:CAMPEP_0171092330 /NCGR_PEP_ID=MMETSP0766_2-20121228/35626_1 /TAXON_ID=439317 /ORGANISM="Gambierdiscus australes, Strain CAWD 149" /LENGTH=159 /DNA_ID=CAMNT_0011550549 /DNA_START=65 /DNA_END=540 /DNA_ORIENTATION=-